MRISDWSSDVCSSDLWVDRAGRAGGSSRPRRGSGRLGMEIDGVTVSRYRAGEPVAAGYGSEILIVEVGTGGGPRGRGFATASSATAPILRALIETVIQPAILGAAPRLTERLRPRMPEAIPRAEEGRVGKECVRTGR